MTAVLNKPAPAFKLLNQKDEYVSLADLKGKWVVLYFYPKALTPGCTTQAQCVRDNKADFEKLNAVVYGISPDAPKLLQKFIDKEGLNFDLLSDSEKELAAHYNTWVEKSMYGRKYMGMERSTFIIDPEGILRAEMRKVSPSKHHEDVIKWLKANQ